jgi:hypothetical protein
VIAKVARQSAALRGSSKQQIRVQELPLKGIEAGMVLGEDVKSAKGLLLIAHGQEVTAGVLERVRNFSAKLGIREPVRMVVNREKTQPTEAVTVTG